MRALLNQVLLDSVAAGWIDVATYSYSAFVHSDPTAIAQVFDYLLEQVAENGILTNDNLAIAVKLARQLRAEQRQPKRKKHWFSWLVG